MLRSFLNAGIVSVLLLTSCTTGDKVIAPECADAKIVNSAFSPGGATSLRIAWAALLTAKPELSTILGKAADDAKVAIQAGDTKRMILILVSELSRLTEQKYSPLIIASLQSLEQYEGKTLHKCDQDYLIHLCEDLSTLAFITRK